MKIDPNMTIGEVTGTKPGSSKGAVPGKFENMLQGIEQNSVQAKAGVQHVMPVDMLSPQKINALSLSEQALGALEDYAVALKDPSVNLRSLAAMVDDLSAIKGQLENVAVGLAADDPLQEIIGELNSNISSEVMRLERGDLSS